MAVSYRGADAWPLYAHTFGAGPATVLLHGGGPDHRSLLPLAEQLSDASTVVLPDLRGFGRSVCTDPACFTWARYTADVVALIDHLGLRKVKLVGTGMGSTIALRVAAAHPDRDDALSRHTGAPGGGSGACMGTARCACSLRLPYRVVPRGLYTARTVATSSTTRAAPASAISWIRSSR